ncbi:hypothetical protein L0152_14215 [bacterium]|nr:hypothetical protein [bacterium]
MISTQASSQDLNANAEKYVRLVLSLGELDADYVDAYYGPKEWREEVKASPKTLDQIAKEAQELDRNLKAMQSDKLQELEQRRLRFITRQLAALIARVEMLKGKKLSFDEESQALYDAVAPQHTENDFQPVLDEINKLIPGKGDLSSRYSDFKKDFIIPKEKLDAVFRTAIQECRSRTAKRIQMPAEDSFTVEYVKGKSWSAYNWYQGGYRSIIQLNTDLPVTIDRAIDLACHEGYPGHHVLNMLIEKNLVNAHGWKEFSVYPLFSPLSLIAEGTANYGIQVAFPGEERMKYEKQVLFPLTGLNPDRAETFYKVQELVDRLSHAGNIAARKYLNGEIDADQAAVILQKYALMVPELAKRRVKFFDQYRSYSINYNLGQDLVRKYIESRGGTEDHPEKRWSEFETLLSFPRLPSELATH